MASAASNSGSSSLAQTTLNGTTYIGNSGNNIYYLMSSYDVVIEEADGGNDTIMFWRGDYTLTANVENLSVFGLDAAGIGNELDNRISGGDGRQQLFGAGGDDILTGGLGRDTFIMRVGNGSDTITDFEAGANGDLVQLGGYGFKTFQDVLSRMRVEGSNVVLQLNGTETLTFQNSKISDFTADNFQYTLDRSKLSISFAEEFNTLILQKDGGVWRTSFNDSATGRTHDVNNELQYYTEKGHLGLGVDPFSIKNGILTITGSKATDAVAAATGYDYTSGLLSSRGTFSQQYGYFEIRAEMPGDQGTWPAFWLLSSDGAWPPELDVMEAIGGENGSVYTTAHSGAGGTYSTQSMSSWVGDVSEGMHTYGMLWTATEIVWYVDEVEVYRIATPEDMHRPMYLVTNLAIGGDWPGSPGSDFVSAEYNIDYIRVYTIEGGHKNIVTSESSITLDKVADGLILKGSANSIGIGNALNNELTGNSGNNILDGKAGADIMAGGAGDDAYYVDNGGDVVTEKANEGTDRIYASLSWTLPANVEELLLTGSDNINATGNALDNFLKGNSGKNVLNGAAGADRMEGGAGDDVYYVDNVDDVVTEWSNDGTDTVYATVSYSLLTHAENLTLLGSAGINATGNWLDNVLTGNSGNNILDGKAGADIMAGGAGDDVYYVDNVDDVVTEWSNNGMDTVYATVSYSLLTHAENLTLLGSAGINATGNWLDNVLTGNSGNNTLDGKAGADIMAGGAGNDAYYVDNGGDVVTEKANEGTDRIYAWLSWTLSANIEELFLNGSGNINATGNALDNFLKGNSGKNVLNGASGADRMEGGAGDDVYYVDNVDDVVTEWSNDGTDIVYATVSYGLLTHAENLTLLGSAGINATGNWLDNVLTGNSGNNVLDGGSGADIMAGGAGDDIYYVDDVGDVVTEWSNGGSDTVRSTISHVLANNVENLTLLGSAGINATGNWLDNVLTGNSGNNILDGSRGADTLIGGAGDDVYYVDNVDDVVTEWSNNGMDTVYATVSYSLLTHAENLTLLGSTGINATGNWLDNVLTGNSGNNTLDGKAGADIMAGGAGNDAYYVDNGGDVVTEKANEGTDRIHAWLSWTLSANVEELFLNGSDNIDATGNALDNFLKGNSGKNVLNGASGADRMEGGAGDDIYYVDNVGDVVTEWSNDGIDAVRSTISYVLANNVENLTLLGSSDINATGNWLDNVLTGNSGNNILDGSRGADTLIGGAGDDIYYVDDVGDVVTEWSNGGSDTVRSTISHVLANNVENLTLLGSTGINATGNWLDNVLTGNSGNNILDGSGGADTLIGGAGADILIGGAGNDTFVFSAISDSTRESRDTIADFQKGDRIDLGGVFEGSLKYLHTAAFTGYGGEVQVSAYNGGVLVKVDIDGDKVADGEIFLDKIGLGGLQTNGGDFLL